MDRLGARLYVGQSVLVDVALGHSAPARVVQLTRNWLQVRFTDGRTRTVPRGACRPLQTRVPILTKG